mmetsp:Transcript_14081/g.57254  ORF Transcript_14081/g.57254 Transcript_14081/m.57254 type:complete len:232 (+) Transcript_14081:114-809(+)
MSGDLACTYAALILSDDGQEVTGDKMDTIIKAAGVTIEPYWTMLFSKFLSSKPVEELIANVGAGGGGGGGGAPGIFPPGGGGGGAGGDLAPPTAVGFEGDSSSSEPPVSCLSMFLTTSSANFSRFSFSADDTLSSSSGSDVTTESASLFAPLPIMFSAILPIRPPPVFFLFFSIASFRSLRFILTRLMICSISSAVTLTSPSSSSFSLSTNLSRPPIAATSLSTRSSDVRE